MKIQKITPFPIEKGYNDIINKYNKLANNVEIMNGKELDVIITFMYLNKYKKYFDTYTDLSEKINNFYHDIYDKKENYPKLNEIVHNMVNIYNNILTDKEYLINVIDTTYENGTLFMKRLI